MDGKKTNNPDNYYELSKPFETRAAAEEALDLFHHEVEALRQQYRIADVTIGMRVDVKGSGPLIAKGHFGDSERIEGLAAYVFGSAAENRRACVKALIEAGIQNAKESADEAQKATEAAA